MQEVAEAADVLDERYIVRRCKNRRCRLRALHPARLALNKHGRLQVFVMCLKCRYEFGAAFKEGEWIHSD
jgi:hypothetical protein